jgi:hypothetical protein
MSLPWSPEPPQEGDVRVRIFDRAGDPVGVVRDWETAMEIVRAMHVAARPRCCDYEPAWSNVFNAPVLFHQVGCIVPAPSTVRLLNGVLVSFSERLNADDLEDNHPYVTAGNG